MTNKARPLTDRFAHFMTTMKQAFYILIILFVMAIVSCGRIKNKGQELADKTGEKVKDKSKELADKVVPHFDAYKADTKFNKERFWEFLQVGLTADIKNIYCFDDDETETVVVKLLTAKKQCLALVSRSISKGEPGD